MEFTSEWFDESSKAWMNNKKKLRGCIYKYTCQIMNLKGNICNKNLYKSFNTCYNHSKKQKI